MPHFKKEEEEGNLPNTTDKSTADTGLIKFFFLTRDTQHRPDHNPLSWHPSAQGRLLEERFRLADPDAAYVFQERPWITKQTVILFVRGLQVQRHFVCCLEYPAPELSETPYAQFGLKF